MFDSNCAVNVDEDMLAAALALGDGPCAYCGAAALTRRKSRNNVSQLAEDLGLSQPTLSHHLRILRQVGLVSYKKMCRDVFYWVDEEAATQVAEQLCNTVCHHDAETEVAQREE
jgi:DNA-binding transcriptional ArsR family regulator